jgi:hypothetical protein
MEGGKTMNGRRALGCSAIFGLVLVMGSLAGCEYSPVTEGILASESARLASTDLQAIVYPVVDQMLNEDPTLVPSGGPIVVGSIADLQDINRTTPLGNAIAELVRSRLVQRHFNITDLRLRSQVLLDPSQGELMLSRNSRLVRPAPGAAEIVSGTYAVGSGTVYVSLKILAAVDARIMAAGDFMLPRTADVDRLLGGGHPSLVSAR